MRTEQVSTPVRIGGEMFSWTDRDPSRGPVIASNGALRLLVTELGGAGRAVLVAGPHDDAIIESLLAVGARVSCLIRAVSDAERLAEAFPAVTVLCGSVTKLDGSAGFDLIVAADGVGRLGSAETEQSSVAGVLAVLAGALAPGGTLALMYDNPVGVHHSVDLDPVGPYRADAGFVPLPEYDDQRPASLAALTEHLAEDGVTVANAYAVFPTPQAPSVFVGPRSLGDTGSPLRAHLGSALAQAFTDAYARTPMLFDPRPLVARALRAGAEGTLAPAWLVIAHRGAPAEPAPDHDVLIGDPLDGYAYEISVSDGQPIARQVADPAVGLERAGLRRVAEPARYVCAGARIFEEHLLGLCARADLAGLRAELGRFAAWLQRQADGDGMVSGPAALCTTATVFDDGTEFRLAPPRWAPVEPVAASTVLVRALWMFAARLITGHRPHPWHLAASAADLTGAMLGMVGRSAGEGELQAAVELQLAVEIADGQLTLDERHNRRLELLALRTGAATIDLSGYRELTEALWRQRYETSHLLAMVEWTDKILRSRDLAHSRMDWEIQFYRRSLFGKVLMLTRSGYRLLRADARKLRRRMRGKKRRAIVEDTDTLGG